MNSLISLIIMETHGMKPSLATATFPINFCLFRHYPPQDTARAHFLMLVLYKFGLTGSWTKLLAV